MALSVAGLCAHWRMGGSCATVLSRCTMRSMHWECPARTTCLCAMRRTSAFSSRLMHATQPSLPGRAERHYVVQIATHSLHPWHGCRAPTTLLIRGGGRAACPTTRCCPAFYRFSSSDSSKGSLTDSTPAKAQSATATPAPQSSSLPPSNSVAGPQSSSAPNSAAGASTPSEALSEQVLVAAASVVGAAQQQAAAVAQKEPASKIIVKVQPKMKRVKTDFSQSYTENIYIPVMRAMNEYLLESSELDTLPKYTRRSPYPERDNITVFRRRDLEQKVINKWGSLENLQLQKDLRKEREKEEYAREYRLKFAQKEYKREHMGSSVEEKPFIFSPTDTKIGLQPQQTMFQHGSGRVVLYAIFVNASNCVMKFIAWLYTGSHSMFSEFLHSFADTANQLILAAGIRQSLKQPDLDHPYGWANFRNVSSLISGVGIFCVGAGLSYYHGIMGLIHGVEVESLVWALAILGGSALSEGATLMVAIKEIKRSATAQNTTFLSYVWRGQDPSTNVVLLEDLAAVAGLGVAAACISLTHYTGNPVFDAVGSLLIGTLLGGVASFIIYTNSMILIGKSIPREKRLELMKELESDRMIRTIHDVKATDVGGRYVKFKAEVDFDGKEITRYYLEQQDLEKMFQEMQSISSLEETEAFMLRHGENIIDSLGGEVDRIERNLKKKHPEIRHCDLEQL